MTELPTGTVTFLFTDIEGSTRLLHELGAEAYDEALIEHRRVLREAFARHGGVEVDTQGDAFFFAFPTRDRARCAAASEGQAALAAGPIRVRMGLHTGTPHIGEEGYVGDDVHLGARIAASGHGGQVAALDRRPRSSSRARADRPRRAPPQGHRRAGIDLPARRRRLPAAEDDLQHEPAAARELVRRPRRELREVAALASRKARAS